MGPAPYPAIENGLDLAVDRVDDFAKLVERRATAVELPTAMIGNHDRIGADFNRPPRVGNAHDTLEREGAAPILPDARGGIPVHVRIEHGVEIILDAYWPARTFLHITVEIG